MTKTKSKITLTAFICGLLLCFAAAPQKSAAQEKFLPGGSYQKSCLTGDDQMTLVKGATLYAICKRKSNGYATSSISDFFCATATSRTGTACFIVRKMKIPRR